MEIHLIWAQDHNGGIGEDGKLPWHIPEDLKNFKKITLDSTIIMGRKTFDTFPKLLPNRTHVVISRKKNLNVPKEVIVVNDILDAIKICKNDPNPYIIGGGEIYKLYINLVDKIELTRVHGNFDADTFFPEFNKKNWDLVSEIFHDIDKRHDYSFTYETYEKK